MEIGLKTPPGTPSGKFRLYQEAKRIVEARIVFAIHLAAYLSVNALLILINIVVSQRTGSAYWFVWPLLLWGSGVLVHGVFTVLYSVKNIRRWQGVIHGRRAMEMLMGLIVHGTLFVILNSSLIAINLLTLRTRPELAFWSVWIVLGWGIGFTFHGIWVYLNKDHKLKRWKRQWALQMMEDWDEPSGQ